jgi:indole-3-glycerol phosphate synthase
VSALAPILDELLGQAREQTERRRRVYPSASLERLIAQRGPALEFRAAIRKPHRISVIAEMKRRTPALGLISARYRPGEIARAYADGGADAISVLTHQGGFGGSPEHLREVRQAAPTLPVLRKDFVVDEHQLLEARALGADAVLLIVAALQPARLRTLVAAAHACGLQALVEAHDEAELASALESGADLVGVNHRDLRTFQVDLALTERLRPLVPAAVAYVAESGVHTRADARRMREAGADAILVGESLMRAPDIRFQLAELAYRDPR